MTAGVDPAAVAAAAVRAAARMSPPVGLFAESSSAMFHLTRALCADPVPYARFSTHYGSMAHGNAGAFGFCAATGHRALVLTGDASFQLMSPLPAAVKLGCSMTMVVLNDSRLSLPYFGCQRVGAMHAQATTQMAPWDFTRQGSPEVQGRRVLEAAELDDALAAALAFDGCFVVDVQVDASVAAPVGARMDRVATLFEPPAPGLPAADRA